MNVLKLLHKSKCDFFGCKNMAEIEIKDDLDSKKKMVFCLECLDKIGNVFLKNKTPKALESPFKKQKKIR